MRAPARIEGVLDAIRRAWRLEPDLRLGQLIVIATRPRQPCPEVFGIEDAALVEGLGKYLETRALPPPQ